MNTSIILLKSIIPNINSVLLIFLLIFSTSLTGLAILKRLFIIKDWYLLIPTAVITGIFGFILFLGSFSYFLKGSQGIQVILIIYLVCGYLLSYKQKFDFRWPITNFQAILVTLMWSLLAVFMLFVVGSNVYGGDTIAYWGFATSFANGNYPLMSPWQPNLLANHHQGVFLYEGFLYALSGANIQLIHSLFAWTIIVCNMLLLWGISRILSGRVFISILPALIFYISFSAIFVPIPKEITNVLVVERVLEGSNWPILTDFKNRLGGSSNLNEIVYINHRAAAFAGMFLMFFLAITPLKIKDKWKIVLLAILVVPIISSDEVVLPGIAGGLLIWFIQRFKNHTASQKKEDLLFFGLSLVCFSITFFLVGSALRDSLLTPVAESARFHLVTQSDMLLARFRELLGVILIVKGVSIYQLSVFSYFIIGILVLLKVRRLFMSMIFVGSIATVVAFFLVEHTYYPSNNGRFLHLIYLLLGLVISQGAIVLINSKEKLLKLGAIFLILLFIPGLTSSAIYLLNEAKTDNYPNFNSFQPDYPPLKWLKLNYPAERVMFIDGYLYNTSYSDYSMVGIQKFGLLVPVSPAAFKVHTPDYGYEAIDLIRKLNPQDLKMLKVSLVFIKNNQIQHLPFERQKDLANKQSFKPLFRTVEGTIYRVTESYLSDSSKNISTGTIQELRNLIQPNSRVYLDDPYRMDYYLRASLWLYLKQFTNVYTEWRSGIFNYIETKMVFTDPILHPENYDYVIVGPKTDPLTFCNCQQVELIWNMDAAKGYKVIR